MKKLPHSLGPSKLRKSVVSIFLIGIVCIVSIAHASHVTSYDVRNVLICHTAVPPEAERRMEPAEVPQINIALKAPVASVQISPIIHKATVRPLHGSSDEEKNDDDSILPIARQNDIKLEDQILISTVLNHLPFCRDALEHVVVDYDPAAHRGLSSATTIILKGDMEKREKAAVLVHECGHITDLGTLTGNAFSGRSAYPDGTDPAYNDDPSVFFYSLSWRDSSNRRKDAMREDFASGYAMTDPWEDLAETYIARILHKDALYTLAEQSAILKAKIDIVEQYYLSADFTEIVEPHTNTNTQPQALWDWTKEKHELVLN